MFATRRELRRRVKTMGVGEDLELGNGWILTRLAMYGLWMIWRFPKSQGGSKLGRLNDVLRHMRQYTSQ